MGSLVVLALFLAFTLPLTAEMSAVHIVARAWERWARARGYVFHGAGVLKSSRALYVRAACGDVEATIDLRGAGRARRTRVASRAVRAMPLRLAIYRRAAAFVDALRHRAGEREMAFGQPALDDAYAAHASPEALARRVLDEPLVEALHALRGRNEVTFSYDEGEVQLSWSGAEEDEALLDLALRAVASACKWRSAGGIYR
jgi:hypothetical protein